MTSRHCFSKMMREDLRHKSWMVALSVLGNMLALPVLYLLYVGQTQDIVREANLTGIYRKTVVIGSFFGQVLPVSAGFIAIAGALIVGLSGFRYVFHKNMTDTYQSLPVKRKHLFLTGWLNGLLIWLIPFLVSMSVTLLLAGTKLVMLLEKAKTFPGNGRDYAVFTMGELLKNALSISFILLTVFLLVYHLTLLAVMLCGNILNTLVTVLVSGVGGISLYLFVRCFFDCYLDTFYGTTGVYEMEWVFHASPLADAVYLLADFCAADRPGIGHWCLVAFGMAWLLWAVSFLAYEKRPSELAEQGLKNRPVRILLRTTVSFGASLGGWLLFWMITEQLVWSVFGALLFGIFVYGVTDIVFYMEFKAFFRHKLLLSGVMAAALLLELGFRFDLMGYDTYLPSEDEIAEIAVYSVNTSNNSWMELTDPESRAGKMCMQDAAAAYAFLETAVKAEDGTQDTGEEPLNYSAEMVNTRVRLKNGKTYYRRYMVRSCDNQAALALMTSPEYLEACCMPAEAELFGEGSSITNVRMLRKGSDQIELDMTQKGAQETAGKLVAAYNQDVCENPEALICGDGRVLSSIELRSGYTVVWDFDVYDFMEHTREVLRQTGYAEYADPVAAEELEGIAICVYGVWSDGENPVSTAKNKYGVFSVGEDPGLPETVETADWKMSEDADGEIRLLVTDTAEMEELLSLLSYCHPEHNGGAFAPEYASGILLIFRDGTEVETNIALGALPEKYIQRFGEIDLREAR